MCVGRGRVECASKHVCRGLGVGSWSQGSSVGVRMSSGHRPWGALRVRKWIWGYSESLAKRISLPGNMELLGLKCSVFKANMGLHGNRILWTKFLAEREYLFMWGEFGHSESFEPHILREYLNMWTRVGRDIMDFLSFCIWSLEHSPKTNIFIDKGFTFLRGNLKTGLLLMYLVQRGTEQRGCGICNRIEFQQMRLKN